MSQSARNDHDSPAMQEAARQNEREAFALRMMNETARCRRCERMDVPLSEMAIFSWKEIFQKFTGVCKECMNNPESEQRYHDRLIASMNEDARS